MNKKIKDKKPSQLKLSSMSEHWNGDKGMLSGKHRSQQIQKLKRKAKRSSKQPPKLFIQQ